MVKYLQRNNGSAKIKILFSEIIIGLISLIACSTRSAIVEDNNYERFANSNQESISQDQVESKFDPQAANLSAMFENPEFVLTKWDSSQNQGFGVLNTDEVLHIKSWANDELGLRVKILKNDPPNGIKEINIDYWIDEIFRYSSLVLSEQDLADVKLSIEGQNYVYDENKSEIKLIVVSDIYSEFIIWAKEVDMETVLIQFYNNRKY